MLQFIIIIVIIIIIIIVIVVVVIIGIDIAVNIIGADAVVELMMWSWTCAHGKTGLSL